MMDNVTVYCLFSCDTSTFMERYMYYIYHMARLLVGVKLSNFELKGIEKVSMFLIFVDA